MVCMALFVRYMYTTAVLHCGNLPAALFVHTILPAGRTAVKSGSTPVRGPVKSGRKQMKEESRGLDKRLVRPELVTAWIQ